MRDMFYKYDNCIDKKEYIKPLMYDEPTQNNLQYNPHLCKVFNAFGDEIGVEAQENSVIRLFFSLSGFVEGSSIQDFLESGTLKFEILNTKTHSVIYTQDVPKQYYYDNIPVEFFASQDGPIKQGTYSMKLYVDCVEEDGSHSYYNLYTEKDGFLRIL